MMRARASGALLSLIACGLFQSATARADAKSDAQALFDEGLRLFDARDYKNACEKFSDSQRADPATATLLNLGRCYEAAGRLASARKAYADAITQARREHDEPRAKVAKQRESAIAGSVPKLTIHAASTDVHVERDGEAATLDAVTEIDAGPHDIVATAPGKKMVTIDVTVAAGETKRVDIPPLEEAVPPPAGTPKGAIGLLRLTPRRTMALAVGGAGLIAAGVGTYFGLHASSLKSDAEPDCSPEHVCDARGVELTHSAGHAADASTALFLVGGVFVAAAVVIWLVVPEKALATNGSAAGWTF